MTPRGTPRPLDSPLPCRLPAPGVPEWAGKGWCQHPHLGKPPSSQGTLLGHCIGWGSSMGTGPPDLCPSAPCLSSGENRTTMHKCYTFLIFMVLLLPSLGLSRWVCKEGTGAGVGGIAGWGEGAVQAPTSPPKRGTRCLGASSEAPGWDSPSLLQPPHHTSPPLQPGPLLPLAL